MCSERTGGRSGERVLGRSNGLLGRSAERRQCGEPVELPLEAHLRLLARPLRPRAHTHRAPLVEQDVRVLCAQVLLVASALRPLLRRPERRDAHALVVVRVPHAVARVLAVGYSDPEHLTVQ